MVTLVSGNVSQATGSIRFMSGDSLCPPSWATTVIVVEGCVLELQTSDSVSVDI